ncbi:MAG: hypothetical protein N4A47_07415 [Clostridia bacterium]|jgi:hypothetical protein|nr:hypothetical protein [Clostridia bacterium]
MKKIFLILSLFLTIVIENYAASPDLGFKWDRTRTLDNNLNFTSNIGKDEAMLEFEYEDNGVYMLEYFLEDGNKTSIIINRNNDATLFDYRQFRDDVGPKGSWGNNVTITEYVDKGYQIWNYDTQAFEDVNPKPTQVIYGINKADKKTGKIFKIENMTVKFKWDANFNKFYISVDKLKESHMHNFRLTLDGAEKKTLNILRRLSFVTKPTHWVNDSGAKDRDFIEYSVLATERPGSVPGLRIEIQKPKEVDLNIANPTYGTFVDINDTLGGKLETTVNLKEKLGQFEDKTPEYFQFKFKFAGDTGIYSSGKKGDYKVVGDKYIIDVVKENDDGTGTPLDADFVSWGNLEYSRIYDPTEAIIQATEVINYDFDINYKPSGDLAFAYTYLNYRILRKTVDSTFLVIKPYKGSGIYDVYQTNTRVTDKDSIYFTKWVDHWAQNAKEDIYIPVDVARSSFGDAFYTFKMQYHFDQESGEIPSQLLVYNANLDTIINPPIPELRDISDIKVVPAENINDDPTKVEFIAKWKIPNNLGDLLPDSDNRLWYEIKLNTMPTDYVNSENSALSQYYQIAKVVYITKVGLEYFINEEGETPVKVNLGTGYFEKKIVLKDETGWVDYKLPNWTGTLGNLLMPSGGTVGDYNPENTTPKNDFFKDFVKNVPKIYFISMKSYHDRDTGNVTNELTSSDDSVPVSVSLDLTNEEVPNPTNIVIDDITKEEAIVDWIEVDATTYDSYMLDSIGVDLDSKHYEFYISQEKSKIDQLRALGKITAKEEVLLADLAGLVDAGTKAKEVGEDYSLYDISDADLNNLRNGNIIRVTTETDKLKLENLDINQTYFIILRTKLNVSKGGTPLDARYSILTEIKTFTTKYDTDGIDNIKSSPESPSNLEVFGEITNTSGNIRWDIDVTAYEGGDYIGYELIRIPKKPLEDVDKTKGKSIVDIINTNKYDGIEVFRLRKASIEKYNKTTLLYEPATLNTYKSETGKEIYGENELSPNDIYYYFVRAIRYDNADTYVSNSFWGMTTITTAPIDSAINLNYERGSDYSRDKYKEVVVSFDAPVLDETKVPSEYEFKIAVRAKEAYLETYSITRLAVKNSDVAGYKRYVYKVSGLKSGTKYYVKVRILDKTKGALIDGTYPSSAYSEYVEARTEFNQDDYDDSKKYEEYIKYYLSKLEGIKNVKEWEIDSDDDDDEIYKYRYDVIREELEDPYKDEFLLKSFTDEDKETITYYLPSDMIKALNDNKKVLKFKEEDLEIMIRPNSFIEEKTDGLDEILDEIDDEDIEDYGIKIKVERDEYSKDIDDYEPLTDEVEIDIDAVGFEKTELDLEDAILTEVEKVIKKDQEDFADDLKSKIDDDEDEILDFINDEIDDTKERIRKAVEDELEDNLEGDESISEIEESIVVKYVSSDISGVKIFARDGSKWEKLTSLNNGFVSSETEIIGSYIAAKYENEYKELNSYEESSKIKSLIEKYELKDYIGNDYYFNKDDKITVYEVNSMAKRMTGDNTSYIKYKDEQDISYEEACYIAMKTFEKKTNININSMVINNHSITGLSYKYEKYVMAAVEYGIIDEDKEFKEKATIGDILEIFKNVEEY